MWRIKLRIKVSVQLRAQIGQGRDSGRVAKGPALTLPFSLLSIFPFYPFCPFIPFPSPSPLPLFLSLSLSFLFSSPSVSFFSLPFPLSLSLCFSLSFSLSFSFLPFLLISFPFPSPCPCPCPCPWLPADRDDRCFGRDRDRFRDSERFESDWRARPAAPDAFDDFPPRRSDDGFGDSE